MRFEWDEKKATTNIAKHGVTFEEAATVFGDPLAVSFSDPDHSTDEERWIAFGMSLAQRLLVVAYAGCESGWRIVSARPMTRRERAIYEENKN
jgi:uncharacterized DUF497 family protein